MVEDQTMAEPGGTTIFPRRDETTFPAARVPPLVALTVGLLAAVIGSGALIMWWVMEVAAPAKALASCGVGVPLGLGVVGWAIRQLWFAPCLVLRPEGLEILRAGQVVMHIPYRNIAAITYQKQEGSRGARIDLIDPYDPLTFIPNQTPGKPDVQLSLTWSNLPRYSAKPLAIVEAIQLRL